MATIESLYKDILGRGSDPGGAAYWESQFGPTIEPEEIATFKAAAQPELVTQAQVAQMYEQQLGRQYDPEGLQYWTQQFGPGPLSDVERETFRSVAARENPALAKPTPGTQTGVTTTPIDPSQSTLSPNFADYVYRMLAKGEQAANLPYEPYTGQRYAGVSPLQEQAFRGIMQMEQPEAFAQARDMLGIAGGRAGQTQYAPGVYDTQLGPVLSLQEYMSPYMTGVSGIAAREARREADIGRTAEQARLAQAGAYGGSRQAVLEAERQRNLQTQIGDIYTKGLQSAYDRAMEQRLKESGLGLEAQKGTESSRQFGAELGLKGLGQQIQAGQALGQLGTQQGQFGLEGLKTQLTAGEQQRQIAQQPLDFGYQQFQESLKYPYQQATFMSSLLGGLPLAARGYDSGTSTLGGALSGLTAGLGLASFLGK
jgi:hypothetical protein